jgi:hypothetical protein
MKRVECFLKKMAEGEAALVASPASGQDGDRPTGPDQFRSFAEEDSIRVVSEAGQQVMASVLTLPKVKPIDVVRQVLSAVEAGLDEVPADDMTRQVKTGLSDREGIYLNFDPAHAVHAAR